MHYQCMSKGQLEEHTYLFVSRIIHCNSCSIIHCNSFTTVVLQKVLGRTFVMVQCAIRMILDHSSFVARLLFGFLPYFCLSACKTQHCNSCRTSISLLNHVPSWNGNSISV
jgi:hypothetical protein